MHSPKQLSDMTVLVKQQVALTVGVEAMPITVSALLSALDLQLSKLT